MTELQSWIVNKWLKTLYETEKYSNIYKEEWNKTFSQIEKKLDALGIATIGNLMSFFPSKYVDLGLPTSVLNAEEGQFYLFEGEVFCVFSLSLKNLALKPLMPN